MNSHEFLIFAEQEEIIEPLAKFLTHLKGNIQDQIVDEPLEAEAYTSVTGKEYYLRLSVVFYRTEDGLLATVQKGELVGMDEYLDAVSEFTKEGSPIMKF